MSGDDSSSHRRDIWIWIAVAANSVVAFVLGAVKIGRSFNYDEAVTYTSFINGGSVWRALTTQLVFNNHQMFSVTQAIAWRLGFVGETAQRLLPVLCGVATVALLTWWVGRATAPIPGAIAGLLLVLNPIYVTEFRLLRGYALATLATLVAAIATERSWSDHRRRWLIVSGVAMTVAVTTHAYSALALAVVAVITISLGHLRRDHLITWAIAAGVTIVIQLPVLDDARRQSEARGSRYLSFFGRHVVEIYLGDRRGAIVLMAILLAAGGWSIARRSVRHRVALAASTGLVVFVVVLLWQVIRPFDLYSRFFVALTPFIAGLAAVGAYRIPRHVGTVMGAVVVALLVPGALDTVRSEPTIRTAAAVVDAARAEGLEVCGAYTVPLRVYTPPVRAIDPTIETGSNGFDDCEVFIAVLRIGEAGSSAATARFEARTPIGGGSVVYSSEAFRNTVLAVRDR